MDIKDNLTCNICFNIFLRPITLYPCIHNYCGVCFLKYYTTSANQNCPQCRTKVLGLQTNCMLTELTEMFLKSYPELGWPDNEKKETEVYNEQLNKLLKILHHTKPRGLLNNNKIRELLNRDSPPSESTLSDSLDNSISNSLDITDSSQPEIEENRNLYNFRHNIRIPSYELNPEIFASHLNREISSVLRSVQGLEGDSENENSTSSETSENDSYSPSDSLTNNESTDEDLDGSTSDVITIYNRERNYQPISLSDPITISDTNISSNANDTVENLDYNLEATQSSDLELISGHDIPYNSDRELNRNNDSSQNSITNQNCVYNDTNQIISNPEILVVQQSFTDSDNIESKIYNGSSSGVSFINQQVEGLNINSRANSLSNIPTIHNVNRNYDTFRSSSVEIGSSPITYSIDLTSKSRINNEFQTRDDIFHDLSNVESLKPHLNSQSGSKRRFLTYLGSSNELTSKRKEFYSKNRKENDLIFDLSELTNNKALCSCNFEGCILCLNKSPTLSRSNSYDNTFSTSHNSTRDQFNFYFSDTTRSIVLNNNPLSTSERLSPDPDLNYISTSEACTNSYESYNPLVPESQLCGIDNSYEAQFSPTQNFSNHSPSYNITQSPPLTYNSARNTETLSQMVSNQSLPIHNEVNKEYHLDGRFDNLPYGMPNHMTLESYLRDTQETDSTYHKYEKYIIETRTECNKYDEFLTPSNVNEDLLSNEYEVTHVSSPSNFNNMEVEKNSDNYYESPVQCTDDIQDHEVNYSDEYAVYNEVIDIDDSFSCSSN